MRGKKLTRQLKRAFDADDFDQDLGELSAWVTSKGSEVPKPAILASLADFLDSVDRTYEQADKMLSIANHSLYLSSEELNQVNRNLRHSSQLIQAMLNSLPEGFLIINREGVCTDLVSQKAFDFLAGDPRGRCLADILQISGEHERASVNEWYSYLYESPLPFDELAAVGPETFAHPDHDRHITLHYKPILDGEGKLHSVVLVAVDVTAENRARNTAEKMRLQSEMILHRYQNAPAFFRATELVEETLVHLRKTAAAPISPEGLDGLRRALHTLKGVLGLFSMGDLFQCVQNLEDVLKLHCDKNDVSGDFLKSLADQLHAAYQNFRAIHGESLGLEQQGTTNNRIVSASKIAGFLKWLLHNPDSKDVVSRFYQEFHNVPLAQLLHPLKMQALRIAAKLGKNVQCEINCPQHLTVDPEYFQSFVEHLTHVVNNAIDHGLEAAVDREIAGKTPEGLLQISAVQEGTHVVIEIRDDGRGIDVETVRAKSLAMGLIKPNADAREILWSIFSHGLSTQENVSDISGRGVGLDAVKCWIENYQGTINVTSNSGRGTTFTFRVPLTKPLLAPAPDSENQHLKTEMLDQKADLLLSQDLLERKVSQMGFLIKFYAATRFVLETDVIAHHFLKMACENLGFQQGLFFISNKGAPLLNLSTAFSQDESQQRLLRHYLRFEYKPESLTEQSGAMMRVYDQKELRASDRDGLYRCFGIDEVANCAVMRLVSDNQLLGEFHFLNFCFNPSIDSHTLDLLNYMTDPVSMTFQNAQLHWASVTDELTQVSNVRYFRMKLQSEIARCEKFVTPLSIVMLDLDHFKKINDTYGHLTGDHVIRAAADCIKSCVRSTDTVARYGGEELVVILPETNIETAAAVAEKIRQRLEQVRISTHHGPLCFTASFGVAECQQKTRDAEALIEEADRALYKAKNNGRNRVEKLAA